MTYFIGTCPDPDTMRRLYDSRLISPMGCNMGWFNNSRDDYLFDQAAKTSDLKGHAKYYYELQDIMVKDRTYIFLYMIPSAEAAKPSDFMDLDKSTRLEVFYGCYSKVWYTKGSDALLQWVPAKVTSVETELAKWKGSITTPPRPTTSWPKQALQARDYLKACQPANDAVTLAQPPYAIYAPVVAIIITVVGVSLYFHIVEEKVICVVLRKRKVEH